MLEGRTPIIVTKVLVPKKRSGLFHRPRLVNFIHNHIERKLILISAAAGYGKTSLLVDFAHNTDLPVCWYALDETDCDPSVLVEYLIATISQCFPQFGQRSRAVLQGLRGSAENLQPIVTTLVNEIHETIPEYFVLVLDDYHLVSDSRPVEAFVDLFLRYLPENCHIILASRTMPKLPLLRLAAYQEVAGLSSNELRFTSDEIQGLLKQEYNLYLPDAAAEELARESEGWVTGILLTTQTFWRGMLGNLTRFKGNPEQVFQYLATEVFAQQPEHVQSFLLASSILRQMHPSLCDQLLQTGNSSEVLDWIEKRNLFITRVEEKETWYKYHHLFREFLQGRLQQQNALGFTELHFRAARIFEMQGDTGEAIHHLFQIQAYEDACRRIARAADAMLEAGRLETLAGWTDELPADVLLSAPELLVSRARVHTMKGEFFAARECLGKAESRFAATRHRIDRAEVLVYRGTVDFLEGKYQRALGQCQRALELLKPEERIAGARNGTSGTGENPDERETRAFGAVASARRYMGTISWAMGKLEQGRQELEKALALYETLGNPYYIANVQQELGNCLRALGNPTGAHLHYQRALALWEQIGNPAALANVLNSMAVGSYHKGDYEKALKTFETALEKAREAGNWRFEGYILAGLGDVHRDLGNYETSHQLYSDALDLATRMNDGRLTVYALDALGNCLRLCGDYTAAIGLIRQAHDEAERHQSDHELASCEVSLGILRYEGGEVEAALEHLQLALALFERANASPDLARVHFHLAQSLFAAKRWSEALQHLVASLDISYKIGMDQFMIVDGCRAPALLQYAARRLDDRRIPTLLSRIQEFRMAAAAKPGGSGGGGSKKPTPAALEIRAFGKGTVFRDSLLVSQSDWGSAQARELFFYLLSHPQRSKEQIGALFWPDMSPARMTSAFHATLYRVRRAVGRDCIVYEEERYRFNRQLNHWCDLEEFEQLLRKAELHGPDTEAAATCYRQAIELYQGDYLEDIYSDWAIAEREALLNRWVEAVARLAAFDAGRGQYAQAVQLYQKVLEQDNLREDVHRRLMECYVQSGERARALQHYDRLLRTLADELGAPPAPETVALHQQIIQAC